MGDDSSNAGLLDNLVLYGQKKHVSSAVWKGEERGVLKCRENSKKPGVWRLTDQQIELVRKAGFGHLRLILGISLNKPLISALVERWRRETNTFHMPVGEMTITLEDVAYLLGLSIDGEPVTGENIECEAACLKYLGKSPEPQDHTITKMGRVRLKWLKNAFSKCPEDASVEDIAFHTRAYLLYLVGNTIFSNTTGSTISCRYLQLFEDFDEAGKYAWGAAALSFLYGELSRASFIRGTRIGGCLSLLQCWSYYRLHIEPPVIDEARFPLFRRWEKNEGDVPFYRKALDSLTPDKVNWRPYATIITQTRVPENIKNQLEQGLGRSQTMLICFGKAEKHLPNRCLRQFGMHQTIPQQVQVDDWKWENRHSHVVEAAKEREGDDQVEYMDWYLKITRRFVGRPRDTAQTAQDESHL